jgi:predicted alpha-1,2-mannosidase
MKITIAALLAGLGFAASPSAAADLTHYVNPFIGTLPGSGNTYPGAQLPFGMISWSPHTLDWSAAGYNYDNHRIAGFGLVHSSGVGCGATCEVPFTFCTGDLPLSPVSATNYTSAYSHSNEVAHPGYYSVTLPDWNINFETTVRDRSGIAHLDYPATSQANVIFNPGADSHGAWDSTINIDAANQTLTGWVRSGEFCQCTNNDYAIYFAAQFNRPFQSFGTWKKDLKTGNATAASGRDVAAYLTFNCQKSRRVTMKVAISFVSVENAKMNLQQEIAGWNFDAVANAAKKEWNNDLAKIRVEGGSPEDTIIFYTALYHSLMMPSIFEDVNGEYCGMDGATHKVAPGHHFLATFSGWDTYRTQAQLWGMLYPDMAGDFCQTFLNMARESKYQGGGGLPLWSLFNDETRIMIGYPADPYIASACAFGATNFDVAALEKVMVDSGRNQRWCGRNVNVTWDYLPEYERDGYCAADAVPSACSRNVEYSVADFAIAQMCKNVGDQENYQYFLNRSQDVFNLINPAHGYMQLRNRDGSWVQPFDRFSGAGFTEGNSAQYTWTVPHSLNKLIRLSGGKASVDAKLDELTSQLASGYDYTSKYYEAGNEPCFGVMPVYNWLQEPWKAQDKLRTVMLNCFANKPGGIPGDDDSGAMSAWYIFGALGWYPEIPGVGGVTLLSPLFPQATLTLPNGKTITITAKNASRAARYIQSMKFNGQPNSKLWLTVDQLRNGANLSFEMGTAPNMNWGAAAGDAPPSLEPTATESPSHLNP